MAEITAIPAIEQDKMQANLEQFRRNLKAIIEFNGMQARVRRASFLALIEQGFTPDQALQLCAK